MGDYRSLRFMGFYLHEKDGYESAQKVVAREIKDRKPDEGVKAGYAPDPKFQESASKFRDDHKAFGGELIARAEKGARVEYIELLTLARAEKLYTATISGPRQSFLQANLAEGHNPYGKRSGLSMTEQVARLTGMESPIEKTAAHILKSPSAGITVQF